MRICDCSTLSTCEVCCPPRTEAELQEQIDDLKSAYKSYLKSLPEEVLVRQRPEDYARHHKIDAHYEDQRKDIIYSELSLQIVHERAHANLTSVTLPDFGGWAMSGGFHRW